MGVPGDLSGCVNDAFHSRGFASQVFNELKESNVSSDVRSDLIELPLVASMPKSPLLLIEKPQLPLGNQAGQAVLTDVRCQFGPDAFGSIPLLLSAVSQFATTRRGQCRQENLLTTEHVRFPPREKKFALVRVSTPANVLIGEERDECGVLGDGTGDLRWHATFRFRLAQNHVGGISSTRSLLQPLS